MKKNLDSFRQLLLSVDLIPEEENKLIYLKNLRTNIDPDDEEKLSLLKSTERKIREGFDEKGFRDKIEKLLSGFWIPSDKLTQLEILKEKTDNIIEIEILDEYISKVEEEKDEDYRSIILDSIIGQFEFAGYTHYKNKLIDDYEKLIGKWIENVNKESIAATEKRKKQIKLISEELLAAILETAYDNLNLLEADAQHNKEVKKDDDIESISEIKLDYLKRFENKELFNNDDEAINDQIILSDLFKPFRAYFDLIDFIFIDWSNNEEAWNNKLKEYKSADDNLPPEEFPFDEYVWDELRDLNKTIALREKTGIKSLSDKLLTDLQRIYKTCIKKEVLDSSLIETDFIKMIFPFIQHNIKVKSSKKKISAKNLIDNLKKRRQNKGYDDDYYEIDHEF